jgi:glycine cleavage system H protein
MERIGFMGNIPEGLKYTNDHEWAKIEGSVAIVGITDYAQHELGDIVYVELPEQGSQITQGDQFGEIEAVKTVAPLNSPVSGKVIEVNTSLSDNAGAINNDPYGEGWIIKVEMTSPDEVESLLTAQKYEELT